jgi:sugar phosphate isomerase/epimerase
VVERCRDAGIGTAIEYMAWTTPSTPAGALAMAEATGASIVVDLLHHTRVGAGVAELAPLVGSGRVAWVQVCDAGDPPAVDGLVHEARHARRAPGDGSLPLAELLAVVPFDVPLSVEVQSDALRTTLPPDRRARLLHERAQRLNTIGYRPK